MWLSCMTVPAVSRASFLHALQRRTCGLVATRPGSPAVSHDGQTKPSGQRTRSM